LSDKNVVLAIFKDEPSADSAVAQLKSWDKSDDRVKLGAMGVLALDDNGNLKTHKMGSRSIAKGGGIGLVLALMTPVGAGAVVGGGLLGALHKKGLGLNEKDKDRISAKLYDGKAAVGVLAKEDQTKLIAEKLTELGGEPEVHAVSDEALKQASTEMPPVERMA
jgi:hypothetical protein